MLIVSVAVESDGVGWSVDWCLRMDGDVCGQSFFSWVLCWVCGRVFDVVFSMSFFCGFFCLSFCCSMYFETCSCPSLVCSVAETSRSRKFFGLWKAMIGRPSLIRYGLPMWLSSLPIVLLKIPRIFCRDSRLGWYLTWIIVGMRLRLEAFVCLLPLRVVSMLICLW